MLFTESCQSHPIGLRPEDAEEGLGSGVGPHPRERGQDPALGTVLQQSSVVPRYSVPPDMLLRVAFDQWSSCWLARSPVPCFPDSAHTRLLSRGQSDDLLYTSG